MENRRPDFTPWLAREENIGVLADALGLELEVEAQEKEVGPFRADILCKDLRDDSWVLIENQLERTDHKHLGQLITYAAGLQAVTIGWVASRFTDEHRAAVDWLNKITSEGFRFFALEVELWRIGDSAAAPKFNVVSKPNEWSKTVGIASRRIEHEGLTETKQLQLRFWESLYESLQGHSFLRPQKPHAQHWTNLSIGKSGVRLGALVNTREDTIGVELYLGDANAMAYFRELETMRAAIEQEIPLTLEWRALPEKTSSRVLAVYPDAPLAVSERWPEYKQWLTDALEAFDRAFRPRIKNLSPENFRQQDMDEE